MNVRRQQLEEVHFLLCSLLPSERFAFLHDADRWSSLLDNYTEHGSAPTDDVCQQPASTCRFQVCVKSSPVWLEVELPTGYPEENEPLVYVKGDNLSRSDQQAWQAVIRGKLDELQVESAEFIVQSLLCLHLLPLLHEQATSAQSSQPLDSPAVSPAPTETYHVLFTSHHLISPTKRRNLHKWASELSLHGFAKIGYPGAIYVEGAQADITEFVSRVKAMQWLALKVRFEERLDTQAFPKLTSGESIDKQDGDTHWVELEKVGEVVEFMRRCGRDKFVTDMGLGSVPVLSAEIIDEYIRFAQSYQKAQSSAYNDAAISPTITASTFSSPGIDGDAASSATSYSPDPHAVSKAEALSYYAGLPSEPTLVYRTGKKQWSPPRGPEAQCRLKELCEVFDHPITKVWHHDLAWKVVSVMDDHKIRFTTIDIVRFKNAKADEAPEDEEEGEDEETVEAKKSVLSPVTIWIGVFPESTTATAAHHAAQSVLVLLQTYQITDVDVDFRESIYTRDAGPRLLKPVNDLDLLVDVVSPLTPALGLRISTRARPNAQGTMALYLAEGGGSDRLLGLSCRHVLIGSQEGNLDYSYHPSARTKDVLLLGKRAYADVIDSIKLAIARRRILAKLWRRQIEGFKEREKGNDTADVAEAEAYRIKTEGLLDNAEKAMEELVGFLDQVNKEWKKIDKRVIGHILRSPPIGLGVSEQHFTEDWGVFVVDRTKLGDGFQGNKMDLGTKMKPDEFTVKCFPRGDANWEFKYPADRLLSLKGVITDDLMRAPDMWNSDGEPCLLVAKRGNASGTTLGRANGIFSIVRDYFTDMSINQTSMEWGIINYDSKSDVFSEPGDSGSIIADIRGRIGGMLTGGSGTTKTSDMAYATPFWWLLKRIQASGFPNAHLGVVA